MKANNLTNNEIAINAHLSDRSKIFIHHLPQSINRMTSKRANTIKHIVTRLSPVKAAYSLEDFILPPINHYQM